MHGCTEFLNRLVVVLSEDLAAAGGVSLGSPQEVGRVERGADGLGLPALRCPICHQSANFDPAGMPGNPIWHLAPREMAWEGKTLGEICAQIKDPARNGNRSVEALVEHIGEDHLVGWAWAPGYGRRPALGTQKEAGALVEAWVKTGAVCPN